MHDATRVVLDSGGENQRRLPGGSDLGAEPPDMCRSQPEKELGWSISNRGNCVWEKLAIRPVELHEQVA